MVNNARRLTNFAPIIFSVLSLVVVPSLPAALAQDGHAGVDWTKLDLNPQQSKQIGEVDAQWHHDYSQLQPSIDDDQRKIAKLLCAHNSDPVEIMALHASIARKREQLSALAVATYLKKREFLTDTQQHTLETMMAQAIAEHEHGPSDAMLTEISPDRIQGLMQRMRSAWTEPGEQR
jgi:Spy/CpxP family protein refolding chaperone